ncbi:MAG: hypothetical protein PVJ57_06215 [Phycisphaerae bacterium]|jgi:hypothetical protein
MNDTEREVTTSAVPLGYAPIGHLRRPNVLRIVALVLCIVNGVFLLLTGGILLVMCCTGLTPYDLEYPRSEVAKALGHLQYNLWWMFYGPLVVVPMSLVLVLIALIKSDLASFALSIAAAVASVTAAYWIF